LERVCDYLKDEFSKYGLEPTEQIFPVKDLFCKNILASYNTEKRKRLLVGAHYVCGDQPGADDNASAVAGLLEIARMVASVQPDIDYRVDFVSYCLEDPPYFCTRQMGSWVHADSVKSIKANIIGVINFEMIGYFNEGDQPYPDKRLKKLYPKRANFIAVVGKQSYHNFNQRVYELMKVDAGIDVQIIDHPMVEDLASLSDQLNYWEFDIPALMINNTSFIRNPNYHTMRDDISTLSFEHMRKVVTSTYKAVVGF